MSEATPPSVESYTDPETLAAALRHWPDLEYGFGAWGMVIPVDSAPFVVAGTDPLAAQMHADGCVGRCCNATQRFTAVEGPIGDAWTGTVCDVSALRPEEHQRNSVAEAMLSGLAVGAGRPHYDGHLFGVVGLHMPDGRGMPAQVGRDRAWGALVAAQAAWSAAQAPQGGGE